MPKDLEQMTDDELAAEMKRRKNANKGPAGLRVREYDMPWDVAARTFGFAAAPDDDDDDDQGDEDDDDGKGGKKRRGFFGD